MRLGGPKRIFGLGLFGLLFMTTSQGNSAGAVVGAPILTKTTIIEGDRTGKMTVNLTQPATIDFTRTAQGIPSFTFSAHQGFAGLLITSADEPGVQGPMYLGMSLPPAFDSLPEYRVTNAPGDNTICGVCPLPVGRYNIYLLTQEAVSLTLQIDGQGLTDESHTYSATPVPADFLAPQPFDLDMPGDAIHYRSVSAAGELHGTGALIHAYFLEGPATEAVNVIARGSCQYSSTGPANGLVTPGCLGGSHHFDGLTAAIQSPYIEGVMGMTYPLPARTSSRLGVYATTVGASGPFAFATIWLTF